MLCAGRHFVGVGDGTFVLALGADVNHKKVGTVTMTTLIRVGNLVMTPKQFKRALAEDMTVSQARIMIEDDKHKYSPSPLPAPVSGLGEEREDG